MCVHLDGLNAEDQFRVWVTILDNTSHFLFFLFKGAVCRIDFFSPGPSSSDLTHRQVARLTTPTGTRAHDDELN